MKVLFSSLIILLSSQAYAGTVSKVFKNHKDKDTYVGKDIINGKSCEARFSISPNDKVLSYHYDTGGYILENAMTGGSEDNLEHDWFEDYIYFNKKYTGGGIFDIIGAATGNNTKEYDKTIKYFFDDNYKITKVIYLDNLKDETISECQID